MQITFSNYRVIRSDGVHKIVRDRIEIYSRDIMENRYFIQQLSAAPRAIFP